MFDGKTDAEVYESSYQLIEKENDRGAALIAAMLTEHCLNQIFAARLLPPIGDDKLTVSFNAPLGTFLAKIDACYRLGCIPPGLAALLNGLRRIRNSFAHEVVADFGTRSIADRTKAAVRTNPAHYQEFVESWSASIKAVQDGHKVDVPFNANSIKLRARFSNYFGQAVMHLNASVRSCPRVESLY